MNKITAALLATVVALTPACVVATAVPASVGIVEGPVHPRHRLTVVSAFSCPYCRILDMQGMEQIRKKWIPKGLQLETVPVIISPTDVPASIAATCGDPHGYARRVTILFRAQPDILSNWNGADAANKKKALAMPEGTSAPEIAQLAGFDDLAPSLGLTKSQLAACLADKERQQRPFRRQRLADRRWHVVGTPTVFIDDQPVGSTWDDVRTALQAAFQ